MKIWIDTGIIAVLVIGMVFMSGCGSPVSTGTAPVAPATTHVVNETVHATPIPASTPAVPASTPPVTTAVPAPPPANNTESDKSTSQYDNPPSTLSVEGVSGSLLIHVASGSADGLTVYIARNGTNVPPFDSSFDPYRSVVKGQNLNYLHVNILPDGNSGIVNLMPGSYLAYLPDRSGGEPEQQSFMINPKYLTYVLFVGHAAGSSSGCNC